MRFNEHSNWWRYHIYSVRRSTNGFLVGRVLTNSLNVIHTCTGVVLAFSYSQLTSDVDKTNAFIFARKDDEVDASEKDIKRP